MVSRAAFLPPAPAPPHDSYSWRLDRRAGWQRATEQSAGLEESGRDGALTLAPLAGSSRSLTEPSGSFGGLVPPANVALGQRQDVYLLDRAAGQIKRFDRCDCRFHIIPCLAGIGHQARQVRGATALAVGSHSLFVADGGNRRVHVYTLRGLALRAHLTPPTRAELDHPWQPVALALDSDERLHVADAANGSVHVFSRRGRWESAITGLGDVRHLAIDRANQIYVITAGERAVRVLERHGDEREKVERRDQVEARFGRLPVSVSREGFLDLTTWCHDTEAGPQQPPAVFDASGTRADAAPERDHVRLHKSADYLSAALDSGLHDCVWDRIALTAELPPGTRVRVRTWTSANELPLEQIEALPADVWETQQTFEARPGGGAARVVIECLITSPPGRYLWLSVGLAGNGDATPRVHSMQVFFPRISLGRHLPAAYRAEPIAADFTDRFLAIFDRGFRELERHIDHQAHLFDPMAAPAGEGGDSDFLSWLGSWIGVTLSRQWPLARRRRFLANVGRLFCMRGTRSGLRLMLLLFLGLDERRRAPSMNAGCAPCTAPPAPEWQPPPLLLEHFQTRRWLFLGAGRLGEQAQLWGRQVVNRTQLGASIRLGTSQVKAEQDPLRDPFHVHAHRFTVFLPARLGKNEGERKAVTRLIGAERPAHTQFHVRWVEPRFRIGTQSMIGYDAVIGRPPDNFVLDDARLGRATVLGPRNTAESTLTVGKRAHLGSTTKVG